MADAFDLLGDATTTDKGNITDYPSSIGDQVQANWDYGWDHNPLAYGANEIRRFNADMGSLAGTVDRIDQKTAEEEVRSRGLDLKIPMGGMTRFELDTMQYLKQREIQQNTQFARPHSTIAAIAGLGAGFAAGAVDPINVASAFIPVVSEMRYAQWLARAGEGTFARAAARAGAGAIEGAVGAAIVEPINYAGATSWQQDYALTDSFLNVAFGTVMGGGLHAIGGAVYDARVSRALAQFSDGLSVAVNLKERAPPDHVQRDALHQAVAALERGEDFDAEAHLDAWHGSPHTFDKFDMSKIGTGEGAQAYGHGLYFAESPGVAQSYRDQLARPSSDDMVGNAYDLVRLSGGENAAKSAIKGSEHFRADNEVGKKLRATLDAIESGSYKNWSGNGSMYQVRINAKHDEFLDWDRPLSEQPQSVRDALKATGAVGPKQSDWSATGGKVLENMKTDPAFAADMRKQGIKGIRYLDANSRDAGQGTRNFGIFDDKDVQIVSRNGEPIAKQQSTPRDLAGLIEQSKADRTQAAFDRQFVDPEDAATSKAADDAVAAQDFSPEDIAAETAQFTRHLESMRERGLVTESMEAEIKAADTEAEKLHAEADAYEAAAICAVEAAE